MGKEIERLIIHLKNADYGVTRALDDPNLLSLKERATGKVITIRIEEIWDSKKLEWR